MSATILQFPDRQQRPRMDRVERLVQLLEDAVATPADQRDPRVARLAGLIERAIDRGTEHR